MVFLRRVILAVVKRRIVEDHSDASLLGEGQKHLHHIRLIEVVGKNIHPQALVPEHRVGQSKDPLARREAEPCVLLRKGVALALIVRSGYRPRIEQELVALGAEDGLLPKVPHKSLRLRETPREAHFDISFDEGLQVEPDVHRQPGIQSLERAAAVKVARRDGVSVGAKEGLRSLMHRTRNVHPAKLVNRRVDARIGRLAGDLGMRRRLLKSKSVEQEVRILSFRARLNGKSCQALCFRLGQVER